MDGKDQDRRVKRAQDEPWELGTLGKPLKPTPSEASLAKEREDVKFEILEQAQIPGPDSRLLRSTPGVDLEAAYESDTGLCSGCTSEEVKNSIDELDLLGQFEKFTGNDSQEIAELDVLKTARKESPTDQDFMDSHSATLYSPLLVHPEAPLFYPSHWYKTRKKRAFADSWNEGSGILLQEDSRQSNVNNKVKELARWLHYGARGSLESIEKLLLGFTNDSLQKLWEIYKYKLTPNDLKELIDYWKGIKSTADLYKERGVKWWWFKMLVLEGKFKPKWRKPTKREGKVGPPKGPAYPIVAGRSSIPANKIDMALKKFQKKLCVEKLEIDFDTPFNSSKVGGYFYNPWEIYGHKFTITATVRVLKSPRGFQDLTLEWNEISNEKGLINHKVPGRVVNIWKVDNDNTMFTGDTKGFGSTITNYYKRIQNAYDTPVGKTFTITILDPPGIGNALQNTEDLFLGLPVEKYGEQTYQGRFLDFDIKFINPVSCPTKGYEIKFTQLIWTNGKFQLPGKKIEDQVHYAIVPYGQRFNRYDKKKHTLVKPSSSNMGKWEWDYDLGTWK